MFDYLADLFDNVEDVDQENLLADINSHLNIEMDDNLEWVMQSTEDVQVLYALDRITNDIDGLDVEMIGQYLDEKSFNPSSWQGLMNNWKGVYGEVKVLDDMNEAGGPIHYVIPSSTTNPGVDIYGLDSHGELAGMYQVKMTANPSYIREALSDLPENVKIICPTEVANLVDDPRVVDAGFTHSELMEDIDDVVNLVTSKEPWEQELYADNQFDNWIDEKFVFIDRVAA